MARSREARARRQQRRMAYADEVLGRIAEGQATKCATCAAKGVRCGHAVKPVLRVKGMVWNNELAVALPNHLTVSEREALRAALPGATAVELDVRLERLTEEYVAWLTGDPDAKFKPSDPTMARLWRLSTRQEHISANGGKIVQPNAGLKGRVTRTDVTITPSWERPERGL